MCKISHHLSEFCSSDEPMATQVRGLIRDSSLDAHYKNEAFVGGKTTNVSKTQKKGGGGGGLGGRKPLGEISNSVKQHAVNQTSKKPSSMDFTAFMKEENATTSVGGKKSFSKPKEKLQTGVRKPLGDISNSRKLPSLNHASKKSCNNLNVLVEEEPFLHNHQECVKAQRKAIDMDYFLQTIGLEKDSSMQLAAASPKILPRPMRLMADSPLKYSEMEELLVEDWSPQIFRKTKLLDESKSSPLCRSPEAPKLGWNWSDDKYSDFKLKETPNPY